MRLIYERLNEAATPPSKVHPTDAGWDVASAVTMTVAPGEVATIPTELAVRLEPPWQFLSYSWYLRIAPRSGLASRFGIDVLAGIIDQEYRGEVKVVVANLGREPWHVRPGDRIAQLIPEVIWDVREAIEEIVGASERGAKGFGSSGQ